MIETGLTAGQVARRLGVAVTTLRSWHRRYGLGPSEHVAGHHRRYGRADVDRLETMRTLTARGVPAAAAARLAAAGVPPGGVEVPGSGEAGLPGPAAPVRGLMSAALRLDGAAVRGVLAAAVADAGVVAAWEGLIRPGLASVEAKQAAAPGPGGLIEVEHLLSRCAGEVLGTVPRPSAPARVLLACTAAEEHSLPLEALTAALAERRVGACLLGARVPAAALLAAVRRIGPDLVVLWSHTAATADPAALSALLHRRPGPPVVAAAGPGWAGPELPAGATGLVSLPAAVELASRVAVADDQPGTGSRQGPPPGIGCRA